MYRSLFHTKLFALALAGVLVAEKTMSQTQRYWISFRDKGAQSPASFTPQQLGITDRALQRRMKVLPPGRLIDDLDLPVAPDYKRLLESNGIVVRQESRWLNAVSAELSGAQQAFIRGLSVVERCVPVERTRQSNVPDLPPTRRSMLSKVSARLPFDYGPSLTQIAPMNVPDVHKLGINGTGVVVGMNDDGFNNHRDHRALKNIRVLAEFDFVQNDSDTQRDPDEFPGQGDHGTATLSVLGGFDSGSLIGPAYGASFLLSKTEMDAVEIQQEIDNYVAGLEWMERRGADIVSSSLGYDDLDPEYVYNTGDIVYALKNGHVSASSVAATIAVRKGVLVVTAMGNERWYKRDTVWSSKLGQSEWTADRNATGSLLTPADADSIVAVGATFSFGEIATFSSTGPTADGRIKPEVVAPGVGIVAALAGTTTQYWGINNAFTQGTSFATPLTASVAALVLSAHPQLTPMQVREALMMTAKRYTADGDPTHIATWPNNYYGAGMVQALDAVLYHGVAVSNHPLIGTTDTTMVVTTWIKSKYPLVTDSLIVAFKKKSAPSYTRVQLKSTGYPDEFEATIPRSLIDSTSTAFVFARDNAGATARVPYGSSDTAFALTPTSDSLRQLYPIPGPALLAASYVLQQNYPNPFNGRTTILFDAPSDGNVELAVFNVLGQRVRTLFVGMATAGVNTHSWDGRDHAGKPVASGVYFCRLKTAATILTSRLMLLK